MKVGAISVDGTKIDANASKYRNVRYDRAGQLIEDIGELLEQTEVADSCEREEGQKLPEELARREEPKGELAQARERLERESIEVLVATGSGDVRQYDFRSPKAPKNPPANSQPWIKRMKQRTKTERGRKKYRMRQQNVEPVFGIIKAVMSFRQFLLRMLK